MFGIRIVPETLRSSAFGAIGAGYTAIGTPFAHPIRTILIQNLTDANLLYSFDGINDHLILPTSGFFLYDVMANRSGEDRGAAYLAYATTVYVKQSGLPTSGAAYVSVFFAVGD